MVGIRRFAARGVQVVSQVFVTALFALSLSFIALAASFADVPRSEMMNVVAVAR